MRHYSYHFTDTEMEACSESQVDQCEFIQAEGTEPGHEPSSP